MGILDSFERGLERVVNGAFARTARSGLQPVEITAALKREMDVRAAPVARDRILVPNHYVVHLSDGDLLAMSAMGDTLIDELGALLTEHATSQRYQLAGPIQIDLESDDSLAIGMVDVSSTSVKGAAAPEVQWIPVLEVEGRRYPLAPRLVVGRGSDADVTIADSGTSRKHLEVSWDGRRATARDLGSTNGSRLNGERFSQAVLENGSDITIGRTHVVFRLVARQTRPAG